MYYIDLVSTIILVIATAITSTYIRCNKTKSWANDPLVGMSWACMLVGTVLVIIYFVHQYFLTK